MTPDALIVHKTDDRLRIRIPSKRGDTRYFADVSSAFSKSRKMKKPEANAATGSLLFRGTDIDGRAIMEFAANNELFSLESPEQDEKPVAYLIAEPLGKLSDFLSTYTVGRLDMPTIAFLGLLIVGFHQIASGKFRSPPWYTAFWYAFGVFSKSIADRAKEYENGKNNPDEVKE